AGPHARGPRPRCRGVAEGGRLPCVDALAAGAGTEAGVAAGAAIVGRRLEVGASRGAVLEGLAVALAETPGADRAHAGTLRADRPWSEGAVLELEALDAGVLDLVADRRGRRAVRVGVARDRRGAAASCGGDADRPRAAAGVGI